MRSPRGFAGSIVLLAGVAIAFASGIIVNAGTSEIIHLALGAGFLLLASALFDFLLPRTLTAVVCAAMVVLALIFLAQAAADISHAPAIADLAYGSLGQTFEKVLGYVFLAWCAAMAIRDSEGWTRILGGIAVAGVIAIDLYSFVVTSSGGTPDEKLKLFYLLLFVWLALESWKPRTA